MWWRIALREGSGALARTGPYIAQAPLAIGGCHGSIGHMPCPTPARHPVDDPDTWSEGVGSNWFGVQSRETIKPLWKSRRAEVMAILPFGYPVRTLGRAGKNRKPFAQVAHRKHFGQPFV